MDEFDMLVKLKDAEEYYKLSKELYGLASGLLGLTSPKDIADCKLARIRDIAIIFGKAFCSAEALAGELK